MEVDRQIELLARRNRFSRVRGHRRENRGGRSPSEDDLIMESTRTSLLLRIRNRRDAAAWQTFDAIYRPMLRRFARARGLAENDTEDVVQHCLVAIQSHLDSFDYDPSKGRFRGWLRTIVNNHVRSLLRKRIVPPVAELPTVCAAEPGDSPEDVFDRIWMEEHLRHALRLVREEIDANTFAAFRLYVLDGWEVDRVCRALELSANQIYRIKWRVTRKLREKMKTLGVE